MWVCKKPKETLWILDSLSIHLDSVHIFKLVLKLFLFPLPGVFLFCISSPFFTTCACHSYSITLRAVSVKCGQILSNINAQLAGFRIVLLHECALMCRCLEIFLLYLILQPFRAEHLQTEWQNYPCKQTLAHLRLALRLRNLYFLLSIPPSPSCSRPFWLVDSRRTWWVCLLVFLLCIAGWW